MSVIVTGKFHSLVFLLEEESMKRLLDSLLPRLYRNLKYSCRVYHGKNDLEKRLKARIKIAQPNQFYVVIRDQDSDNCLQLKRKLYEICNQANSAANVLVRIPCHELEAWYLGDPEALDAAYGRNISKNIKNKKGFRDVDAIRKPSDALLRLVPEYAKVGGSEKIAPHLSRERNQSKSFQVFLSGIDRLVAQQLAC